jgi:hypothetical protein
VRTAAPNGAPPSSHQNCPTWTAYVPVSIGWDRSRGWRKRLFIATSYITANAAEYFGLPRDRTIMIGSHIDDHEVDGPQAEPAVASTGLVAAPSEPGLLRLQRTAGNAAVIRQLRTGADAPGIWPRNRTSKSSAPPRPDAKRCAATTLKPEPDWTARDVPAVHLRLGEVTPPIADVFHLTGG